jgi:hypothetical protein
LVLSAKAQLDAEAIPKQLAGGPLNVSVALEPSSAANDHQGGGTLQTTVRFVIHGFP